MPISFLSAITTKELLDIVCKRSVHYKRVKLEQLDEGSKIEKKRTYLNELCDDAKDKINRFQRDYGQILQDCYRNFMAKVEMTMQDLDQLMINAHHQHTSPFTANCWQFIND